MQGMMRSECTLAARWVFLVMAMAVGTAAVPSAAAAGDEEVGKAKFSLCAPCHGGDGRSGALPEYPKIAGQNRKYLVNALQAYKSGRRTGTFAALMAETAKNLSDADIDALASYVAGLDAGQ